MPCNAVPYRAVLAVQCQAAPRCTEARSANIPAYVVQKNNINNAPTRVIRRNLSLYKLSEERRLCFRVIVLRRATRAYRAVSCWAVTYRPAKIVSCRAVSCCGEPCAIVLCRTLIQWVVCILILPQERSFIACLCHKHFSIRSSWLWCYQKLCYKVNEW